MLNLARITCSSATPRSNQVVAQMLEWHGVAVQFLGF